jgi:hypothetical protein
MLSAWRHAHRLNVMIVYPFLVRVLYLEMIAHCRQRLVSVISKRTEQPWSSLGAARWVVFSELQFFRN